MFSRMRTMTIALALIAFSSSQILAQQNQKRALPHYFPEGIITPTQTPAQQWAEYLRWVEAVQRKFYGEPLWNGPFIADGIKVEKTIDGKKFFIVLDHHNKLPDGRIRFVSYLGSEIITDEQLQTVVDYTFGEIQKAVDLNFDFYKDLRQLALESLAASLKIASGDLEKVVDQKVSENPKFTFEELYWLPKKMEKKDFVPREVHVGYGPDAWGALGWAWLDTGLVYLNPMAQVLDYLVGAPVVTQHELMHANKNLQSLPFSEAFDVELAASIPEMLTLGDYVHLQFHSYVRDLREMAWVFFGYDYKRVRKEIVKFDAAGVLRIDEEKFNHYSQLLNQVKAEYMKFFPKAIGEFYGKIVLWSAFQDKLVDKRAIWRIMMRKEYEPTILGGREKTAKWLKANEQNIREDAQKAWDVSGEPLDNGGGMSHHDLETLRRLARIIGVDPDDRPQLERLAKQYKIKPEELTNMKPEQIVKLVREILENKRKQGGR